MFTVKTYKTNGFCQAYRYSDFHTAIFMAQAHFNNAPGVVKCILEEDGSEIYRLEREAPLVKYILITTNKLEGTVSMCEKVAHSKWAAYDECNILNECYAEKGLLISVDIRIIEG